VSQNLPRADLKKYILELKGECNGAAKEEAAVATDVDSAPAALKDPMAAGVKEAADFMSKATTVVADLEKSYATLEDSVDKTLALYGEAPTTDAEEWVKDIDRFVAQFEAEYKDLSDALARKRKREALAEKRKKRQDDIDKMQHAKKTERPGSVGKGQLDKLLTGVQNGAALEDQNGQRPPGGDLQAHAVVFANKLRRHHAHHTNDDDDDDEFEFDD